MNREMHKRRHKKLGIYLNKFIDDYLDSHKQSLKDISLIDLIKWSKEQIKNPDDVILGEIYGNEKQKDEFYKWCEVHNPKLLIYFYEWQNEWNKKNLSTTKEYKMIYNL